MSEREKGLKIFYCDLDIYRGATIAPKPLNQFNYNQTKSTIHSIEYQFSGFSSGTQLRDSNTLG